MQSIEYEQNNLSFVFQIFANGVLDVDDQNNICHCNNSF